ncbi:hypothetical protein ACFQ0F_08385 [Paraperlucidibaca wandonensis]|uniref:Helix-destabilizing protein n=1 Tax=Paraperlucidibaca wandonensis TaxID=1268273 RepID=A0ABW3HGI2_9GAMM
MSFLNSTVSKKSYLMNIYPSKGVIQSSGQAYDTTHVWLMAQQKNPNGTSGFTVEMCRWGTSENAAKFDHIRLDQTGPIEVEIELREVHKGTGDNERKEIEILNMRLVQPSVVAEKKAS